jgi:hypothetical protein
MDVNINPDNVDEWEATDKFYVSHEHDGTDMTDECSDGCDWCMPV